MCMQAFEIHTGAPNIQYSVTSFPLFFRASIPFQQAHHLVNPWNDHKKVQISRDGQVRQSCELHRMLYSVFMLRPY